MGHFVNSSRPLKTAGKVGFSGPEGEVQSALPPGGQTERAGSCSVAGGGVNPPECPGFRQGQ